VGRGRDGENVARVDRLSNLVNGSDVHHEPPDLLLASGTEAMCQISRMEIVDPIGRSIDDPCVDHLAEDAADIASGCHEASRSRKALILISPV
jgi:hypothetical protein